jgi:hypothetical protein
MMKGRHPEWNDRQCRNPIYWQGYFRKIFHAKALAFCNPQEQHLIFVPEAMGVDVTKTCLNAGITLEWPPMDDVFMIALYAKPQSWAMGGGRYMALEDIRQEMVLASEEAIKRYLIEIPNDEYVKILRQLIYCDEQYCDYDRLIINEGLRRIYGSPEDED